MNLIPKKPRKTAGSRAAIGGKKPVDVAPPPAGVPAPPPAGVPAAPSSSAAAASVPGGAPATGASWTASPGNSECLYPPGGFMNFIRSPNGNHLSENFHFVGAPMSQTTISPTAACWSATPSPPESSAVHARGAQLETQEKETIDIDNDDTQESARSEVRLNWSHAEDVRLVSAWLRNCIDPVEGNDRKSEKYWGDVAKTYNSTTEDKRKRNINQLKIRWDRIKKPLAEFTCCWNRISAVYQSGVSDDQLMDRALEMFASEHNEKAFTLQHLWKLVRHERKWAAHVKKILNEKENSRKGTSNSAHVVNIEDNPAQRPMGHKRAKEVRDGKRKASNVSTVINEKLEKFIEASTMAREGRDKMAEVQQKLADKKLEAAKIAHKTAREKTKYKMLETYKELMFASTSDLSEQALAERSKALESMRLSLFSNDD